MFIGMRISVVIPAYNEEKYLPATLVSLAESLTQIPNTKIIVVDNESSDATRESASAFGARVITESEHNIGAVRNAGARAAVGELLFFLDADTLVSPGLFEKVIDVMSDEKCVGGSVAVEYMPGEKRRWIHYYLLLCLAVGKAVRMRQGAAQFCRKDVFEELSGYDETIYVGEDVEFQWRLEKLARDRSGNTAFIEEPKVRTSSRRFDKMGFWRTVVITHPITVFCGWRKRSIWKDWYEHAVR
jgi:glycosyltransferase involved in cell wall biosynthesis